MQVFVAANAVVSVGALVFALTAMRDPATLSGTPVVDSTRYYAFMYAVRSVPLCIGVLVVLFVSTPTGTAVMVLSIAGAAQIGDLLIGSVRRIPGQMIGGAVAAITHLVTAWYLVTSVSG